MKINGRLTKKYGLWYIVIDYYDDDNNRKSKWYSTKLDASKNKREANLLLKEKLDNFEKEYYEEIRLSRLPKQNRQIADDNKLYFEDYIDKYIDFKQKDWTPLVAKVYATSYKKAIRNYFEPLHIRLNELIPDDIIGFYDSLREKGLSESSVKHYSNVINPALKLAKLNRLITENPHEYIPPIKRNKPIMKYYDKDELAQLLEVIKGNKYELPIKIAVYYGLRRSEIVGLRWKSIDFTHKTITINHKVEKVNGEFVLSDKLKTEKSYRTMPLFETIEQDLIELKKQIKKNIDYYKEYYNYEYSDYLFVNEIGELLNPDTLGHQFKKIIKENGLKDIRFHDLRHSCASLMIANKIPMKQIQEWLGHSNFSTTADVYSHLDFSSKVESANIINNALEDIEPTNSNLLQNEKTIKPKPQKNEKENCNNNQGIDIKQAMEEMKLLGVTDIKEYIKVKEALKNI